jgi:predicted O-methyltransferase YrrM
MGEPMMPDLLPATVPALLDLAAAFRPARVLITANRIGLLTALADRTMPLDELARVTACDPRGVAVLLRALAEIRLLEEPEPGSYRLAATNAAALQAQSGALGVALRAFEHEWRCFTDLEGAVRQGGARPELAAGPLVDSEINEGVVAVALLRGLRQAEATAWAVPFAGVRRVLDVGASAACQTLVLAHRFPGIGFTMLDRPFVLQELYHYVEMQGLEGRVQLRPGEYRQPAFRDFGGPYDLVLLAGVLSLDGPRQNADLLRRLTAVVAPGGSIVVSDTLIDSAAAEADELNEYARQERLAAPGTAPGRVYHGLLDTSLLASTERGRIYDVTTVREWLAQAGFGRLEQRAAGEHMVVLGRRQGAVL